MQSFASSNSGHSTGVGSSQSFFSGNGNNGGFRQRYFDRRPGQNNGKSIVYCDFCHIRGHTRETYYKLHKYPKRK